MARKQKVGSALGGGFFAGGMGEAGERYALIVAPATEGQRMGMTWKDGMDFCASLETGGVTDWRLPTRDELAMMERNLGPNRSKAPKIFRAGGVEAFNERWYWSSTEHASYSLTAWMVSFRDGSQGSYSKYNLFGVRAVRRLPI